ncbi:TonB-dependent receptor [Flavobacteriaceae bacterium S356]|uniref:TonB-dependent receptor n=1 Tax=Asprobacillus argus TaxID=3076534 RepID=A0ABU3LGC8_9FLAO|nr:TonB-dependent receptor [Flavobacteriaceae bacterium S356]
MKHTIALSFALLLSISSVLSQGRISGKVIDAATREPLVSVNISIVGTSVGGVTKDDGTFEIENAPFGYVKIQASYLGYKTILSSDYLVTQEKTPYILIELEEENSALDEVVIKRKLFKKNIENPLSLKSLGLAEIEKIPGGNRDILKVLQSLPGVASNPGFRNDIIIRGGAPSENKFYLDGIEVPVINHFQTQGATGGPVGIVNTDLIRNVDFYSSAFSANRGNTLSSVIEFTQKTGNPDRFDFRATLGTSDAGITIDGPLGKNTTLIASVRQSYLQVLFKLIKLPFLPTYNDFQFNIKTEFENSQLSIIGIGAIDTFELNEEVNNDVSDEETLKRNRYILANIPVQNQWNYTIGANYKVFKEHGTQQFVLSRSVWDNSAIKYFQNSGIVTDLLLDYDSREIENRFRFENRFTLNGYSINVGVGLEQSTYKNTTFQQIANSSGVDVRNYHTKLNMFKYALFGQLSKRYFGDRLSLSAGFRLDANDYNSEMKNPWNQFSPRISVNYALSNTWSLNATTGIYQQLPAYTILGFRNNASVLVNRDRLKFLKATHVVLGLENKPTETIKLTLEGFYKRYSNYPFSLRDQISLANLGSDFGVVGTEEVTSNSEGRAFGFELLAQKKSYDGLYGILSYTYVRSEFKNASNQFIPATWDNRHLLTFTGGKKLQKNWEIGVKYRLVGGRPYTPYDMNASSLISNYNVANQGILDFTQLNTARFNAFSQLDVRIDKTWYWKKWALNFYVDIQNLLNNKALEQPFLTPSLDVNGNPLIDPNDANRYILEEIKNENGTVLPRFGFIVDF